MSEQPCAHQWVRVGETGYNGATYMQLCAVYRCSNCGKVGVNEAHPIAFYDYTTRPEEEVLRLRREEDAKYRALVDRLKVEPDAVQAEYEQKEEALKEHIRQLKEEAAKERRVQ